MKAHGKVLTSVFLASSKKISFTEQLSNLRTVLLCCSIQGLALHIVIYHILVVLAIHNAEGLSDHQLFLQKIKSATDSSNKPSTVNLQEFTNTAGELTDLIREGLHISPLEFIAIIINLWLALKLITESLPLVTDGYISRLLSDNINAISWMQATGKCRDPAFVILLVFPPLFSSQLVQ